MSLNERDARAIMVEASLGSALSSALVELASHRGTADLSWLDEMEAAAIQNTRNADFVGPIQWEAAAMEHAIAVIRNTFQSVRTKLAGKAG